MVSCFSFRNLASRLAIFLLVGSGTGSSLVYAASNTERFASRRGPVDTQADRQLTPNRIAAGEIFISWIFDLGTMIYALQPVTWEELICAGCGYRSSERYGNQQRNG